MNWDLKSQQIASLVLLFAFIAVGCGSEESSEKSAESSQGSETQMVGPLADTSIVKVGIEPEQIETLKGADDFTGIVQPFLIQHCVECHGPKKKKGGFRVDTVTADLDNHANVDYWQNIVDYMVTDEMPPEDEPRPDPNKVTEVNSILMGLVKAAQEKHESGGGKPARRLSQQEYINTVYDLLGIHILESEIPDDGSIGVFDTDANSLYTTDMHLETYLKTARQVIAKFIASRDIKPGRQEVKVNYRRQMILGKYQLSVARDKVPAAGQLIMRMSVWQRDPKPDNEIYLRGFKNIYQVMGTKDSPGHLDIVLKRPITGRYVQISFLDEFSNVSTVPEKLNKKMRDFKDVKVTDENFLEVQSVAVRFPFVVQGIKGIQEFNPQPYHFFRSYADVDLQDEHAEDIIRRFLTLISRGQPIDEVLLLNLTEIYHQGRVQEMTFWDALVEPLAVAMCSMQFMFHFEDRSESQVSGEISEVELANRMAYFLWRSAPDAELLELAKAGKLFDQKVYESQLARMMTDDRFDRFLNDFSQQWLELKRQDMIAVDNRLYPDFNDILKPAMKEETIAFLSEMVESDRPLKNLIDSDFMVLNNVTAMHYGIKGVYGDHFRVVKRDKENEQHRHRGGIMTHAGILMQTGTGERTSIVERGVFIAEKLLNHEPPPPPANVAALPTDNAEMATMTAAKMIEMHRSTPQCASCHDKIDPLGLGLENFDAVGLFRTSEKRLDPNYKPLTKKEVNKYKKANKPLPKAYFPVEIVTNGTLPDGTTFDGVDGLKQKLLAKQNRLAEAYIEALLSFANGRKSGASDGMIVEAIMHEAESRQFPAGSLIKAVMKSPAFKQKKSSSRKG